MEGRFCCIFGPLFHINFQFFPSLPLSPFILFFIFTHCVKVWWWLLFHPTNNKNCRDVIYLFKLDNLALTHVAPHRRYLDKLWVIAISSNALDPPLSCDTRDYRSLLMLGFCVRSDDRREQPAGC